MNIIVVHDRTEVASQIRQLIEDLLGHSAIVDTAEDSHTARNLLSQNVYDLLIIDLTIPYAKGKTQTNYENADNLLKEIFDFGDLNIPGDVIGMTRDLDALRLVKNSLGTHLMLTIEEDSEGVWKGYLKDKIAYARRASATRYVSVNQHYDYDALIVTAMDAEAAPYLDMFDLSNVRHFPGAREFVFNDKSSNLRKGILFSVGSSGQASAASWTQSLVTCFRPRLALMSGYCGGMRAKVNLGDLIVFEAAYAWDYGKWSETGVASEAEIKTIFLSRPNPIDIIDSEAHRIARKLKHSDFNTSSAILGSITKFSRNTLSEFEVHICPAASGSAVVANDEIVGRIRGLNESIWAVDMESYGFYHSAKNTQVVKPHFLCLKSVSDFCNGEKGDDLHTTCSYISAAAVQSILMARWDFSR